MENNTQNTNQTNTSGINQTNTPGTNQTNTQNYNQAAQQNYNPNYQQNYNPNYGQTNNTTYIPLPEEYRPISMWGYLGYQLLFSIPCIGFIILVVFALGGSHNINVRNFARSYFCYLLIGLIIVAIFVLLGGAAGLASYASYNTGY